MEKIHQNGDLYYEVECSAENDPSSTGIVHAPEPEEPRVFVTVNPDLSYLLTVKAATYQHGANTSLHPTTFYIPAANIRERLLQYI